LIQISSFFHILTNNKYQKEIVRIDSRGDFLGRIETSIVIKAPPERVWKMLALDRLLEWCEGYNALKSVEYTSEVSAPKDKYRVGASAHGIPKKEGESIKHFFEITESLENKKITLRMYGKTFRGTYTALVTWTLEPIEKETEFTHEADYGMPWGILGKILGPLFVYRIIEKEVEKELENLKTILEK
jgi:uncharacterized protein YndB with AHSA1/START domain